jgi:hypothetical protein
VPALLKSPIMQKEIPILFSTDMVQTILQGRKTQTRRIVKCPEGISSEDLQICISGGGPQHMPIRCPYGKVGDVLWVRETWGYDADPNHLAFKADDIRLDCVMGGTWTPSIHMPKKFARIWLKVTSVRVERLHDIKHDDAVAEGIEQISETTLGVPLYAKYPAKKEISISAAASFQSLWESIKGEQSWTDNPWVWVLSFEVLSTTGRPDNI